MTSMFYGDMGRWAREIEEEVARQRRKQRPVAIDPLPPAERERLKLRELDLRYIFEGVAP